ncbi:hypothetical protein KP509_11G091700 [Ceratopteris richardii]|nr:hypothetical protein KP509_11G091700 [Ceratopteris richardii]
MEVHLSSVLDAVANAYPCPPPFHGAADLDMMLHIFLSMKENLPSHTTYWSFARACNENKYLCHAKQLFGEFSIVKFDSFSILGEYLVGIFAKFEDEEAVLEAFHVLPYRSSYTWTALMFMYVDQGKANKALEFYELMQAERVEPNERTFVALLQACGCARELEKGRSIHEIATKAGMATNAFVICTAVSMYGKCGSLSEALHTFHQMPKHSVVSWTAILSSFLEQGEEENSLQLYKMMLREHMKPNDRTITIALQACGELARKHDSVFEEDIGMKFKCLEIGRALHSGARKKGYHMDTFVNTALICMYGKCGSISEAEYVLISCVDQHNIVLWNALLSSYLECGLEKRALLLYAWMLKQNVPLNKRTYVIIIQAICILAEKEEPAMINKQQTKSMSADIIHAIHNDVQHKKFDDDTIVGSTLVSAYGKCGMVANAEIVFFRLKDIDVIAWTVLLSMYVEAGEVNKALHIYMHIQERGITLDDSVLLCGLQACADVGNTIICDQIHFTITSAYDRLCTSLALNLIHTYGECTGVRDSEAVFDQLYHLNVVLWTSMLDGCIRAGKYRNGLNLFEEMKQAGIVPDGVSFLLSLTACGHIGLVEKGIEYFDSMYREYKIAPTIKHYACMVSLFSHVGDFVQLENLLTRMSAGPTMAFWLFLLEACRTYGNVKMARWVFDQVRRLDPNEIAASAMMEMNVDAGQCDFSDFSTLKK